MSFGLYAFLITLAGFAVCLAWLLRLSDRIDDVRANYLEHIQGVKGEIEAQQRALADLNENHSTVLRDQEAWLDSLDSLLEDVPEERDAAIKKATEGIYSHINAQRDRIIDLETAGKACQLLIEQTHRTVSSMRTVANVTPPKPGAYVARSWRDAKAKINEGEPSINAA